MKNIRYMNITIDVVHHTPPLQSIYTVKYNCTLSIFFSKVITFIIYRKSWEMRFRSFIRANMALSTKANADFKISLTRCPTLFMPEI
jgi:hypothetical protein